MVIINENTHKHGYILGLPFLQAFNVIFDYENQKIGFANKRSGRNDAYIYGIPDPIPVPQDDNKIDPNEEFPFDKQDDPID